jgi:hypothetical protein
MLNPGRESPGTLGIPGIAGVDATVGAVAATGATAEPTPGRGIPVGMEGRADVTEVFTAEKIEVTIP